MSTPTRTFRGRAIDELIPKIQAELGAEAIIVRRRDGLTGGILGFFQHRFVEIEAMAGGPSIDVYDEDGELADVELPYQQPAGPIGTGAYGQAPPAPPPAGHASYRAQTAPRATAPPSAQPPTYAPAPAAPQPARHAPAPLGHPHTPPPPPARFYAGAASGAPDYGSAEVTAHLAALARADRASASLRAPASERRRAAPPLGMDFEELLPRDLGAPPPPPPLPREPSSYAEARSYTPELAPIAPRATSAAPSQPERRTVAVGSSARARAGVEKSLRRVGVGEAFARELIEGAMAHTLALAPRSGLAQAVRATLAQHIPVAPALPLQGAAIVVIGAGGTGKTTCCATLLASYRASSTLPASFATLLRDGARAELGLILSPQVMKPAPIGSPRAQRALRRARSGGVLVLDTPRLSPVERSAIRELARVLAELRPERIVVALPATLGATAAAQLLEALRPLGANAIAVTHADETDQLGVAIEAACAFGLAPEFMLDRGRAGGWRLARTDPTALAARLLA